MPETIDSLSILVTGANANLKCVAAGVGDSAACVKSTIELLTEAERIIEALGRSNGEA